MAKKQLYAYKDVKTGFENPIGFANDNDALRWFAHAANQKTTKIGLFPKDYQLYQMGTIDENTGKIEQSDQHPKFLGEAISFVKLENTTNE